MKFEKLNQKKFEKIEKNELGKLVGGACPGYEETAGGEYEISPGVTHVHSGDWDNRVFDGDGYCISGSCQYIINKDMACPCNSNISLG